MSNLQYYQLVEEILDLPLEMYENTPVNNGDKLPYFPQLVE